ncbi:adenosine deaminase [Micropruina sp.]|uniref:adenosine deaminase n=1 Tax=Micropruina sp. TaxID=2737536 RepID=UPI0039E453AF
MTIDSELLRTAPKVSLHDHLDGGVRPGTVLELSAAIGHPLPASTAEALADWFHEAASSGSLVRYLTTFEHTLAVMQTAAGLHRIAREYVADLAADGVVYGETRWAPEQHLREGLTVQAAVDAVRQGLADGMADAEASGHQITVRQLLTSLRTSSPSTATAQLTLANRHAGVAGFDLAGAENGFPPSLFRDSFELLGEAGVPFTIHAGEAAGPDSMRDALDCGAHRLGHGVRIIDDIEIAADGAASLGELASTILDRGVVLEMCPSSNVQTAAVGSLAEHPLRLLDGLGFRVTVNCDNRLMSRTTLTHEFELLANAFDYTLPDVRRLTLNAAAGVFASAEQRAELIERVESAFDALGS